MGTELFISTLGIGASVIIIICSIAVSLMYSNEVKKNKDVSMDATLCFSLWLTLGVFALCGLVLSVSGFMQYS